MSTIKVDTIVDEDGSGAPNFTHGATGIAGLTPSIDDNANATAITIDSSENVLANTTSTSVIGNGGFAIKPQTGNGTRVDISNAGEAMLLDGAASGPIIGFYGNGTQVGNIGTANARLSIGGTDTGIMFKDSADNVIPWNTGSNGSRDGTISLGEGGGRFKDLYLSGGIHLGGTGLLNKLDDYEYGSYTVTATPETSGSQTLHGAYRTLTYTKIGRLVKVQGNVYISSNSSAAGSTLFNLPFASSMHEQSKSFSVLGTGSYATPSAISLISASGSMRAFQSGGTPLPPLVWYSIDFTYIVNV